MIFFFIQWVVLHCYHLCLCSNCVWFGLWELLQAGVCVFLTHPLILAVLPCFPVHKIFKILPFFKNWNIIHMHKIHPFKVYSLVVCKNIHKVVESSLWSNTRILSSSPKETVYFSCPSHCTLLIVPGNHSSPLCLYGFAYRWPFI